MPNEPHMTIDDDLARALRAANPARADDHADPHSAAADQILASAIGQRDRRPRRSRLAPSRPRVGVALVAVGLVAVPAATATYAWIASWGGHAGTSNALSCVASNNTDGQLVFDIRSGSPIEACRRAWPSFHGTSPPQKLTACVDRSRQGSIKVYPGSRAVCQEHDATPYRGPTPEQRRLADFRDDLEATLPRHGCVSYPDLQRTVEATLAKHRLQGWRIEDYQNTDVPHREGGCADVSFIDEPKRTVVLVDALAETTGTLF